MANTLRKSSKSSRKNDALNRPVAPAIMQRARKIAAGYHIVLEATEELGYMGSSIEFPGVFADGKTPDACVDAMREALASVVGIMIEAGERPPTGKAKRTMQVNIRLTPEEKYQLSEAAARLGFRAIADFMRAATLDRCGR